MKPTDSQLLQEAVADARALRELSIETARDSLLERFTPRLKQIVQDSMLEAAEDDDDDLEMDLDDMEDTDDGGGDEELSDEDLDEISRILTQQREAVSNDDRHSNPDTVDRMSDMGPRHAGDDLLDLGGVADGYDASRDEEAVMAEVMRRLGLDEGDHEDHMNDDLMMDGDDYMEDDLMMDGDDEFLELALEGDDEDYMDEGGDEDYMDEIFDFDLAEYGSSSVQRQPAMDQVGIGGTYLELVDDLMDGSDSYTTFDGEGTGAQVDMTEPAADPLDEIIDLSDVLREERGERSGRRTARSGDATLRRENRRLTEKLERYRKAVGILRDQIRESEMVTRKLQCTNKLFNRVSMSSKQRTRVIEAFDRAQSVREINLTYRNLLESMTGGDSAARPGSRSVRKLRESVTAPGRTSARGRDRDEGPPIINEAKSMRERFQELAGITDR